MQKSRMEVLRNQIDNCVSSVFTKEDILKMVDKAIEEEQESRRMPITETEIDTMRGVIQTFVEHFDFGEYAEIDEGDIRLSIYEREIEVMYEGGVEMSGGFNEQFSDLLQEQLVYHLFEVV